MNRRKNTFANGRNRTSPFLMVPNWVFDSAAFRNLAIGPRALLLEVIRRYNGANNGKIGLGHREAAKALGVNKDTAGGYFHMLEKAGFISCSRAAGFNMKDPTSRRASEWRLTWEWCGDQAPTKDFMNQPAKSTVRKTRSIGLEIPDSDAEGAPQCPKNPDLSQKIAPSLGPKNPDTYTSSHRQGQTAQAMADASHS